MLKSTLKKDLQRDNRILTELLEKFGTWDPAKDSKVNALVDMLRDQHSGEKVLIFTEYADMAADLQKRSGMTASPMSASPSAIRTTLPRSPTLLTRQQSPARRRG